MQHYCSPQKIGMLLFPRLTQLDLTGPFEVFARMPSVEVFLLAPTKEIVMSDTGLGILPTMTFDECPELDVLFIPGGPGITTPVEDEVYRSFILKHAQTTRYITAVCTGSLVLGALGLLDGFRATTHWLSLDILRGMNVKVEEKRVVKDRNRMTGGGVTAGIDMALTLAAELFDEETAKAIQLSLEYHPHPPFESGHPSEAAPELVAEIVKKRQKAQEARRAFFEKWYAGVWNVEVGDVRE